MVQAINEKQYKVSFCITCKGRLDHLKETLPKNLANNADYTNTEFVVLDYDSRDGLAKWMRDNYRDEITSGKIRYAHYIPAKYFKVSHAKNMAHRLATGDILCNLDADNVVPPGFAAWLDRTFNETPDALVRPSGNTVMRKVTGGGRTPSGARGRIAMSRESFYGLTGYDETYTGYGNEDNDLFRRAKQRGLKRVTVPEAMIGEAIEHSNERRVIEMAPEKQEEYFGRMRARNTGLGAILPMKKLHKFADRINAVGHNANPSGLFGMVEGDATLRDIDGREIALEPLTQDASKGRLMVRGAGQGRA